VWAGGHVLSRQKINQLLKCLFRFVHCAINAVYRGLGAHLSSEPRAIVGLRFSMASSDGKAPSSERSRENRDRRGAVSDANDELLLKKKTE